MSNNVLSHIFRLCNADTILGYFAEHLWMWMKGQQMWLVCGHNPSAYAHPPLTINILYYIFSIIHTLLGYTLHTKMQMAMTDHNIDFLTSIVNHKLLVKEPNFWHSSQRHILLFHVLHEKCGCSVSKVCDILKTSATIEKYHSNKALRV